MLLRLTPELGGDGSITGIIAMNDTGSNILTVFHHDLLRLGSFDFYAGWEDLRDIVNADGVVTSLPVMSVQVQLVGDDDIPWSPWIDETAVLKPDMAGVARLSGEGMRSALFFGTPAGNDSLAVASTKHGMYTLL